jgi:aspartate racemase
MIKHIGIVGCSAEGAALCYKIICMEGASLMGPHAHPQISMHTHSLSKYVSCLEQEDITGIGELMLSSAAKLAAAGADFLICPDNTIHQAMGDVIERSSLPWLHIAEIAAAEAAAKNFEQVALIGTHWLVESDVYPVALGKLGVGYIIPDATDRQRIGRIIMDELVYGKFRQDSTAYLQQVIGRLKNEGCDAVIMGCTEIPLILNDSNSPLPTLDSTRLLARAALAYALDRDR